MVRSNISICNKMNFVSLLQGKRKGKGAILSLVVSMLLARHLLWLHETRV